MEQEYTYFVETLCGLLCAEDQGYLSHPITGPILDVIEFVCDSERRIFDDILTSCDIQTNAGLETVTGSLIYVCSDAISWGRLITLISFSAYVLKKLPHCQRGAFAEALRDALLLEQVWVVRHGGVEALRAFCQAMLSYQQGHSWNGLRQFFTLSAPIALAALAGWYFLSRM